jgi:hypothetical protein
MDLEFYQKQILAIFIILIYFNSQSLARNKLINYTFCFIPFIIYFLYKISSIYLKIVSITISTIRSFLFISFIPLFFQYLIIFHLSINLIWLGYLTFAFYGLIYISFPLYVFLILSSKLELNFLTFNLNLQIKLSVICFFLLYQPIKNKYLAILLIILADNLKNLVEKRISKK